MKKIDKLVISSFFGPFILTFFITMFVLVMQFLWKYIDDLIGKGLELDIIMKLLFYSSATMVPMAIPLAVLLASLMTFGNFGEHYELVALKSSGVSLFKTMRGLIVGIVFITFGSFYFSNYVLPVANLKFGSLLYDIRQQKPALNIREGIFYNGIEGYSIRIGKKDPDHRTIFDVMIYDHTSGRGSDNVLVAKKGEMYTTENGRFLHLKLYDGSQFQEVKPKGKKKKDKEYKQLRTRFSEWEKIFDLSSFQLTRTDENLFRDHYQMLNLTQLENEMDTLRQAMADRKNTLRGYIKPIFTFVRSSWDSVPPQAYVRQDMEPLSLDSLTRKNKSIILKKVKSQARNVKNYANVVIRDLESKQYYLVRHELEWHRKFSLSVACLVLFFIGAPLGAIIRKGGLGMPLVVSVLFFVFYYVISISSEKSAKEELINAGLGMWLSTLILFPLGFFLTFKAMYDSSLFNLHWYIEGLKKGWVKLIKRSAKNRASGR